MDWLAQAQIIADEICRKYKQIDSSLADGAAQEAVMLYELCPKLRKWSFEGWVSHRIWVAHLLKKQEKAGVFIQEVDSEMAKNQKLPQDIKDQIIHDVSFGLSHKQVAAKYGVGLSTVSHLTQGIKKPKISQEIKNGIAKDIASGMSKEQTARKYNVSVTSVRKYSGAEKQESGDGFIVAEELAADDRARLTEEITELTNDPAGTAPQIIHENAEEQKAEPAAESNGDIRKVALCLDMFVREHIHGDFMISISRNDGIVSISAVVGEEEIALKLKDR